MTKVVFIAKTDLNTDGRILNQIKILEQSLPNVNIDFILLPDSQVEINVGRNVKIHPIKTFFRNNKYLRVFTVLEFIIKSLSLLLKLKPDIIHAHDSETVISVYIYRLIKGENFKLIYDDHEIPNENESFTSRVFNLVENKLMKMSDYVIFANKERMDILKVRNNLKNEYSYFLNLPYFEEETFSIIDEENEMKLDEIDRLIKQNYQFILHQGPLEKERGRDKLAVFSRLLPSYIKILLLGGTKLDFDKFIVENNLDPHKFHFIGSVNYLVLPKYWEKAMASIIMYLPTYINNRLCAPNRFYISLQKGLPVIVNKDNPVLSNFVEKYNCGVYIEDVNIDNINEIYSLRINEDVFSVLKTEQIDNFISIYNNLLN